MKNKLFYFKYIVEFSLVFVALFLVNASSYKMENYSTNENMNRNVNLSTMAIFINKEEEDKKMKKLCKLIFGDH